MSDFVLDNSVTMRWCFDAGAHAYADHVLSQLETRRTLAFVPILWRYEVSAVLARAEIKAGFPAERAAEFLRSLAALDIRVDDEGASRVLTDVHALALQYRLTSYDAAYLELAQRQGGGAAHPSRRRGWHRSGHPATRRQRRPGGRAA